MAENKKKKVSVPRPDNSQPDLNKNISHLLLQKMDKDVQTRIAFSAISLDVSWLVKIFAVGCEEMYVRTVLKDLPNHSKKRQKELLNDLKSFGYIVDKSKIN